MKIIIIGGVAGGATAAARLRRLDETAQIIVLERGGFVSYANCGLPYYIGGEIKDKAALTLQTPESFMSRFRVEVRVRNEVTAIDPQSKTVTVNPLDSGEAYTETYDKLILSPGAKPVAPPFDGINSEGVFTLRTVEDSYKIHGFISAKKPRTAVVVGGGFIGLEMAENLVNAGISTTLLQYENQILPPIDYDMACQIHAYLRSKNVVLRLEELVEGFEKCGEKLVTRLKGKAGVEADMVILAIGVAPDTHLAAKAGLKLGIKGAIAVNDRMETSAKDIYAVGDAVEVTHFVTGEKALISLAGPANKQGRIAADNICGIKSSFKGSQGSSVIKLFGMTAASTGVNEKTAQATGIKYDKTVNFSAAHATYYPNATSMTIKTLFEPQTGKILGAQIVGFDGVDKRIDVLATAIRAGMTAADLTELELAYAPPYSSAKDPVNMVGYTIENVLAGLVKQHHWHDIPALQSDKNAVLLDVRTPQEYARGHIAGSINIPLDDLRGRMGELDKTKKLYVNCQSGLRSYLACRILAQNGFDCSNFSGGYRFYEYIANEKCYATDTNYPCGIKI